MHILTDGRDVLDGSSFGFVEQLEKELKELREQGVDALIASGGGRMYVTMDRYDVCISKTGRLIDSNTKFKIILH